MTIALTRFDENPERVLRKLSPELTDDEGRAIARRLLAPLIDRVLEQGKERDQLSFLSTLARVDPAEAVERLERTKFTMERYRDLIRGSTAEGFAAIDPDEAAAMLETIKDVERRLDTLVKIVDELPVSARTRQLALLERATLDARSLEKPYIKLARLAQIAERFDDLGERAKATALLAEATKLDESFLDKKNPTRAYFAEALAGRDPARAIAIFQSLELNRGVESRVVPMFAARLSSVDPERASFSRDRSKTRPRATTRSRASVERVARSDPARPPAHRSRFRSSRKMLAWTALALGLTKTDKAGAIDAVRHADKEMSPLADLPSLESLIATTRIIGFVEAVEPALFEETLFRELSLRKPSFEPRDDFGFDVGLLYLLPDLARYDRDLAAIAREPVISQMRESMKRERSLFYYHISLIAGSDPRLAVEALESLPVPESASTDDPAVQGRLHLATFLIRYLQSRREGPTRPQSSLGNLFNDGD